MPDRPAAAPVACRSFDVTYPTTTGPAAVTRTSSVDGLAATPPTGACSAGPPGWAGSGPASGCTSPAPPGTGPRVGVLIEGSPAIVPRPFTVEGRLACGTVVPQAPTSRRT